MNDQNQQTSKHSRENNIAAPQRSRLAQSPSTIADKVTLIAGGATPAGQSLAVALAERGSDVIILTADDRRGLTIEIKAEVEACGRSCLIIEEASINRQTADAIIEKIYRRFGRLDVYIDYTKRFFGTRQDSGDHDAAPRLPGLTIMQAAFAHRAK